MITPRLSHVIILTFLQKCSYTQRRIIGGQEVAVTQKKYMAYLIPSEESPRIYDEWICGGVIIHPQNILTSAACIEDIEKAYAVAGYYYYVKPSQLNDNECTKAIKRRVISTSVPVDYELSYDIILNWAKLDIAVVKVDKPYELGQLTRPCSYSVAKIDVNFDKQYESPGTHVIALGWGHHTKWRFENESSDLNQKNLHYVSSVIISKDICKQYYIKPNMSHVIGKYMVCTFGSGFIDETGQLDHSYNNENIPKLLANNRKGSDDERKGKIRIVADFKKRIRKKNGICQNDHGGPLITWIQGKETVIGVASVFRVDNKSECAPPYLFTSTALNKALIDCIVNEKNERRSTSCRQSDNKASYKVIRRNISWKGFNFTIDKEVRTRPQVPLNYYQGNI